MTASRKHRLIIVGIVLVLAAIVLMVEYSRGNRNKYCVQHIESIEQGGDKGSSGLVCFSNLAEEARYITDGALQLDPDVSEEDYRIAINDYYHQLKQQQE